MTSGKWLAFPRSTCGGGSDAEQEVADYKPPPSNKALLVIKKKFLQMFFVVFKEKWRCKNIFVGGTLLLGSIHTNVFLSLCRNAGHFFNMVTSLHFFVSLCFCKGSGTFLNAKRCFFNLIDFNEKTAEKHLCVSTTTMPRFAFLNLPKNKFSQNNKTNTVKWKKTF